MKLGEGEFTAENTGVKFFFSENGIARVLGGFTREKVLMKT